MLNTLMRDVTWRDELVTAPSPEDIQSLLDPSELMEQHLRVVNDNADLDYVERLCRVVYAHAERYTHRAILPQTRRCVLGAYPVGPILLTYPPVLSVDSLEYFDGTDWQTWDAANYGVSLPQGPTAPPGRVVPVSGVPWPVVSSAGAAWPTGSAWMLSDFGLDAVRVTYTAGYQTADSPAELDVPEDLRHGMLLLLEELYRVRGVSVQGMNNSAAVFGAQALFDRYRVG